MEKTQEDLRQFRIRVSLTPDEWKDVRKKALDADMTTERYVSRLIRKGLALED